MELKKSYRGLVLWMLVFLAGMTGICLLPMEDGAVLTRLMMSWMSVAVALLAFIIWRTEQVYWYNGTEYEAAVEAGSERRKAFGWKHFRIFGGYALLQVIFSCVLHLIGARWWIDIVVTCVGLCAAAFATMPIKL